MNKKGLIDGGIIITLIILLFLLIFFGFALYQADKQIELQCQTNCIETGGEYVKSHSGRYGNPDECWCKINKENKRIW